MSEDTSGDSQTGESDTKKEQTDRYYVKLAGATEVHPGAVGLINSNNQNF